MTNELMNNENVVTEAGTPALNAGEEITQDNENFTIIKQADGKYRKEMKYKKLYTKLPQTDEEMKELFKVFNSQDDSLVVPMKNIIGKELTIEHVFMNPYQSFDENTGGNMNGVTTTIYDGSKYVATSSKSVYYTVLELFNVFGFPSEENYKPIKVIVTGTRRANGTQIDLELQ